MIKLQPLPFYEILDTLFRHIEKTLCHILHACSWFLYKLIVVRKFHNRRLCGHRQVAVLLILGIWGWKNLMKFLLKLANFKMAVSLEPFDRFWCFNFWEKALDVCFHSGMTAGHQTLTTCATPPPQPLSDNTVKHTTKHPHPGTFVSNCVLFMFQSGGLGNSVFFLGYSIIE